MAKAQCGGCPQTYSVTADGVMRKHVRKVWDGHKPGWIVTDPCPGAGKPPRGLEALAVVPISTTGRGRTYKGSLAPPGALLAQRKAYAKMGLKWPPDWAKKARKKDDAWKASQ